MLLCFPWHAHMVGCSFEAMMAALGAVVQHFITFPGSACPFYWRHLESFGVVQKWGTPMYPLDPMVDHRFPHQNCSFADFCGTPYGWTWLDMVGQPISAWAWSNGSCGSPRFDDVPRGMDALTDGTGLFGFLLLVAGSGLSSDSSFSG